MNDLDRVIDIKPKKFVLTDHLLNESLPKKFSEFEALPDNKRMSFAMKSFLKTGVYPFSQLPTLLKNKWLFEGHPERYFRFDRDSKILYVCAKRKNGQERVISGYDFRCRENFELRDVCKIS